MARTYKMADPFILLWFIYLFFLKKRKRRKYRIESALQMYRNFVISVSSSVHGFLFAWFAIVNFFELVFHVFAAEYHYCGPCYHSNQAHGQA